MSNFEDQIESIFAEFHVYRYLLFASLLSIFDLTAEKREEKEKMEVIRTSALKLVYPRGGSTCPLKISKRSTIEYRERD